jgi:hypothetical protein
MHDDIKKLINTFEAVAPLVGNALKSGQLLNPQCELTEPDPDVLCEYDSYLLVPNIPLKAE